MDQTRIDGSPHAISAVSRRAGLAVGAIGAIVLLGGWVFGIENLKSAGSSITMKTNAALCLALSGVSLWCLSRERLRALGVLSAATVGLIAAATLSEHIFQIDLGLDQLFFSEPPGAAATVSPNRMGVNASFSLLLESIAILSLYRGTLAHVVRAQMLAAGASILAIVPIVGYIYGAQELFALARLTGIAWPTAFSLLLLSQGVLFARLDAGPITPLVGKGAGATMARRMWGPALVLPFVLGYLQVAGQRAGVYDTGFGTALFSICVAAALWFTLWRTAIVLDRVDVERSKALAREHRARLDAEQAAKLKDDFITGLSHELRTPLNAIVGWTQLLSAGTLADGQRQHAAEVIARNGEHLTGLVEDLLDLSRIAVGHLELASTPIDVGKLVKHLVETSARAAGAAGIRLVCDVEPRPLIVRGEDKRLRQIVSNLLSNAIKFTDKGGQVIVTARANDGRVQLKVADTGCGIDAAFLPYVFDKFRQEDSTPTRAYGGLGLGLTIVKDLTALHGGVVTAESQGRGEGTTMTIELPLA